MKNLNIALVGNPNVGKSVIFNQLTGGSQHVSNWPGKTIEKAEGKLIFLGKSINIIDLPGTYSLFPFSTEEKIVNNYLTSNKPDVIINVVDASNLERNLFITSQLKEMGLNIIVALNMVDITERRGIKINIKKLSKLLRCPVIPTIAVHGKGIQEVIIASINSKKLNKYKTLKLKPEEHYKKIHKIITQTQKRTKSKISRSELLDNLLLNNIFGYLFLALILFIFFSAIFFIGDHISAILLGYFESFKSFLSLSDPIQLFLWDAFAEGLIAGTSIALPFLIPFYILLSILEDSGYLPRIAFLMDNLMHKVGLHGKSFLPLMLGFGCSVPAVLSCRIMESEKQQILTAILATMIPCAARSVIIFGVVGAFLGLYWALGIYFFSLIVVFILSIILSKLIKGPSMALILHMPSYKFPSLVPTLRRTFYRIQGFIKIAFPIIILSTFIIKILEELNFLHYISSTLSPITVDLLGLPEIIGIILIVGILRKELLVILLAALLGTTNFLEVLTPIQMIVLTIVSIFYIPCTATIATLYKEFGLRKTIYITLFEISFAIFLGFIVKIFLETFISV